MQSVWRKPNTGKDKNSQTNSTKNTSMFMVGLLKILTNLMAKTYMTWQVIWSWNSIRFFNNNIFPWLLKWALNKVLTNSDWCRWASAGGSQIDSHWHFEVKPSTCVQQGDCQMYEFLALINNSCSQHNITICVTACKNYVSKSYR